MLTRGTTMQTETEAPPRVRCRIERTVNGHLLYLRYGYWVTRKSEAQILEDYESAENARRLKHQGGRIAPA